MKVYNHDWLLVFSLTLKILINTLLMKWVWIERDWQNLVWEYNYYDRAFQIQVRFIEENSLYIYILITLLPASLWSVAFHLAESVLFWFSCTSLWFSFDSKLSCWLHLATILWISCIGSALLWIWDIGYLEE